MAHLSRDLFLERIPALFSKPGFQATAGVLISATITFAFNFGFVPSFLDGDHEFVILKPALDWLNGNALFGGTFTQYGAAAVLLAAGAVKVFGAKLIAMKYLALAMSVATSSLLYLIWKRFQPAWSAILAVVFWNALTSNYAFAYSPWPSTHAVLWALIGCYALLLYFESDRSPYIFVAGAMAAVSFLAKQNIGFCVILSGPIVFGIYYYRSIKTATRTISLYLAGTLTGLGVFFVWLGLNDSIYDWWTQSIVYALGFGQTYGGNYTLWPLLHDLFFLTTPDYPEHTAIIGYNILYESIFQILPVCNLLAFGFSCSRILLRPRSSSVNSLLPSLLVSSVIGTAIWVDYFPVGGVGHAFWGSTLMPGMLTFLIYFASSFVLKHGLRTTSLVVVFYAFLISPFLILVLPLRLMDLERAYIILQRECKPVADRSSLLYEIRLPIALCGFYANTERLINTYINGRYSRPKVVLDGSDGIYLAFVRDPAKNFHPMWPTKHAALNYIYPDFADKLSNYIMNEHPIILTGPSFNSFSHIRLPNPAPNHPLALDPHYTVTAEYQDFKIFEYHQP